MTSLFRDLPIAVQKNSSMVPPPPLVPLVADPVVLAHPLLQTFPSIAIQGFACPRNVLTCAYWLVTGSFFPVPIGPAITLPAMLRMIETYVRDFPVATLLHNPVAPLASTIVHISGALRSDGYLVLFVPPIPGLVPMAHFCFIQRLLVDGPPLAPNQRYVLFSDIPLMDNNIYWHATVPSAIYQAMRAQGRACLCKQRCLHEPQVFRLAPSMAFDPSFGCSYHVQILTHLPPYSSGPNNRIAYTCMDGTYLVQENATGRDFAETHPSFELQISQVQVRLVCCIHMQSPIRLRVTGYSLVASTIGIAWQHLQPPKRPTLIQSVARTFYVWTSKTLGVSSFRTFLDSSFSQRFIRTFLNPILPKRLMITDWNRLITRMMPRILYGSMVLGAVISGLWFVFELLKPSRALAPPLPFSRNWMPPSMAIMPYAAALKNRLAAGPVDANLLRAALRRYAHEHRHEHLLNPIEVEAWIEAVATSEGRMMIPQVPVGHCATCKKKASLRKRQCLQCRKFPVPRFQLPLITKWVGMLPLYSVHPKIPVGVAFRVDVVAHYKGFPIESTDDAKFVYDTNPPPLTVCGRLCGPMFVGFNVNCYPRGIETTIMAFAARVGVPVANVPAPMFWMALTDFVLQNYLNHPFDVVPMTEQEVLDHQKDPAKRRKLQNCYAEMDNGMFPTFKELSRFGAFSKLEKHVSTTYADPFCPGLVFRKPKLAPRLINSPHPHVNARMAPKTIPVLKWLKALLHEKYHIFYAGCSTPTELNNWLNEAIQTSLWALEDDVSMMDASHTADSQDFAMAMIRKLLSNRDFVDLRDLLLLCRKLRISQSGFKASADDINASGVPLTSFLNSITTAFVRLNAIVYAYTGLSVHTAEMTDYLKAWSDITCLIRMAVSGDDGGVFVPECYHGVHCFTPEWMERYIEAWTWSGFDVGPSKIKTHSPESWRLFTFLAMRPVWSGERYEFGVEISRRMKTMFWMLDKKMHPTAWARGVATSLLLASHHVPVVRDICYWFLESTKGAVTHVTFDPISEFTNVDSTFYQYEIQGRFNNRGYSEFLDDYHIEHDEYIDFQDMLAALGDVHVNLDHIVLRKILSLE
jgi:hypothetical protein